MTDNNYPTRRIADLADDDKPREKALKAGVASLSTTELIAISLGSGIKGKSVIDLSHEILQCCGGSLETLSKLSVKEMSRRFKGVGPARAVGLAAAIELGRRCAAAGGTVMPVIRSSADAYNCVKTEMQFLDHEEFKILTLSRANRVKSCETISTGGTAATVVDVKMLIKRAVDSLADGIILVHNHPSGTLRPSIEDDKLTQKIVNAAKFFDIRVLDHIIVTSTSYYSYLDEGKMP